MGYEDGMAISMLALSRAKFCQEDLTVLDFHAMVTCSGFAEVPRNLGIHN